MKVALVGGGGCFALNFAKYLDAQGIDCFGIGRSKRKSRPFWLVNHDYLYYQKHIVDEFSPTMALLDYEKPDVIVNFAAQGEGAASFGENAPDFFRTNVWGLSRIAWLLTQRSYLKRFIHIGSSEVYGSVDIPSKETDPLNPSSPYSISKAAFDQYLISLFKVHGFPMNIIRPSNCYTPGQQLHRVIPKAIICALSRRKLQLEGGGKAQKSYLHADDLSAAILAVIENAPAGEIYNVGPASPVSIRVLINHVAEVCGVTFDELVKEVPERVGQDSKYHLDSMKIAKDCKWTQTMNLGRGLNMMVEWVKKYPEIFALSSDYKHRI